MTRDGQDNGATGIGVEAIERIGVAPIAEALGISPQAIRKWRRQGKIPDDRQNALRGLLAELPEQVAALSKVAEVSKGARVVSPVPESATKAKGGRDEEDRHQALAIIPSEPPKLEQIAGQHAQASMTLLVAAREVDQARLVVDVAAADARGLPPALPVRGYKTRLAILFALDFPILTMAFVSVTQVSPIIAAGSAIALSLGLVLAAHAVGARLRALADHLPAWVRDVTALVTMLLLIAAVIGVATDLRLKGFELEDQLLASAEAGLFDEGPDVLSSLPEPFVWAMVRAASLVTVLLTVFGVTWSYQHHGPQRTFALAERAYRRALRRYARAVQRSTLTSVVVPVFVIVALMTTTTAITASADDCDGPAVLAFIDTTTAYDDRDRALIMPAIDDMVGSLAPDSRLIIRTVRDAPSSSRLLLDRCAPPASAFEWTLAGVWRWLISNPASARAVKAEFRAGIRDALLPELRREGDAAGTALIDTLGHFAGEIERLSAIWLFTDLLESVAVSTKTLLSRSDSLTGAVRTDTALDGIDVHVAGVGRFHDEGRRPITSKEHETLIDNWSAFVRHSGGELHLAQ